MPEFPQSAKYVFSEKPATVDEAPPVQDTWYTLLNTTQGAELDMLICRQENGELDPKLVEFEIVIDGTTFYGDESLINGEYYSVNQDVSDVESDPLLLSIQTFLVGNIKPISRFESSTTQRGGLFKGKNVLVRMRMTVAPGTFQTLKASLYYRELIAVGW